MLWVRQTMNLTFNLPRRLVNLDKEQLTKRSACAQSKKIYFSLSGPTLTGGFEMLIVDAVQEDIRPSAVAELLLKVDSCPGAHLVDDSQLMSSHLTSLLDVCQATGLCAPARHLNNWKQRLKLHYAGREEAELEI
jgi:hypothetical protein